MSESDFFNVDILASLSGNNVPITVIGIVARTIRSSPTVFTISKLTEPIEVGNLFGPSPHASLPCGKI